MPHVVVISLTQSFALLMGGLFIWGALEIHQLESCLPVGSSLCLVLSAISILLFCITAVLFAFAVYLFKAYSE